MVQTADNKESYELFWNDVIVPLLGLGIPQEHFICVPGNHDVQRAKIEEKKILYTAFLSRNIKEIDKKCLTLKESVLEWIV